VSTSLLSKLQRQQRSCINCNELFIPDARNRHHQHYCKKSECRSVSKRAAQHRWLTSSKGSGYFSGEDNKRRVQEWRKAHPEYWKRQKESPQEKDRALQDLSNSQVIENQGSPEISQKDALQDLYFLQPALIIGLIANLTGSTLQDDIAATSRRLIDSGRDILGKKPYQIPITS
jgi:hypothetical protein